MCLEFPPQPQPLAVCFEALGATMTFLHFNWDRTSGRLLSPGMQKLTSVYKINRPVDIAAGRLCDCKHSPERTARGARQKSIYVCIGCVLDTAKSLRNPCLSARLPPSYERPAQMCRSKMYFQNRFLLFSRPCLACPQALRLTYLIYLWAYQSCVCYRSYVQTLGRVYTFVRTLTCYHQAMSLALLYSWSYFYFIILRIIFQAQLNTLLTKRLVYPNSVVFSLSIAALFFSLSPSKPRSLIYFSLSPPLPSNPRSLIFLVTEFLSLSFHRFFKK